MSLYHLTRSNGAYKITKLDPDYHVEATYLLSLKDCSCPAGKAPTCRHRQMLPLFLAKDRVNRGWMLDWDKKEWRKPLVEDQRTTPAWIHGVVENMGDDLADAMALAIGPATEVDERIAALPPVGIEPIKRRRI